MKHLKLFSELNEMADITKVGKKVYADDKLLKNLTVSEISENIGIYLEKTGNLFISKGKFFTWFMDSVDSLKKLASGEYSMLFFPKKFGYQFNVSPIIDIWKKSYLNKFNGTEHVLGMIEGTFEDNFIIIELMSVKPPYKRNKINKFLIDSLKENENFKGGEIVFDLPSEDGYIFIESYDPNSKILLNDLNRPSNDVIRRFPNIYLGYENLKNNIKYSK